MRYALLIVGVIVALLGGLWLLQGLGIIHVQPVLCVGDCTPLEGPSLTWAIAGFVMLAFGILAVMRSLKRFSRR